MEIECITIETITIRVGDVRLEITPAQAHDLYEALRRLFSDNQIIHMPVIMPATVPVYPMVPTTTWRSGASSDYVSVWQPEVMDAN